MTTNHDNELTYFNSMTLNPDVIEFCDRQASRRRSASNMSMEDSHNQCQHIVYELKPNTRCFISCLTAALGGALHGFHNAIMGGIISRPDFIIEFFPEVVNQPSSSSLFCQYSSQRLALVTSSLFLASVVTESTGFPAYFNRQKGRTFMMKISGTLFGLSSIILASAVNVGMIILARCVAGVGLSFATVSVLLYISEVAPAKSRGRYNQLFQLQLTGFIVVATVANFAVMNLKGGWRLTAAVGFVPALMFVIGACYLPDSPSSLMERGKLAEGNKALKSFRVGGPGNSDENILLESYTVFASAEAARSCTNPWKDLFSYDHRPQLVLVVLSTLFQQFTGINFVIFYGPQLFRDLGKSDTTALWITVLVTCCNHLSTYVSYYSIDKSWCGRRHLLIQAGFQMFIGLLGLSIILSIADIDEWVPWVVLTFVCIFDTAYAWSWGPIGWLYPTEIQDLASRSAGITVSSIVNVFFSFLLAQISLHILCTIKAGLFYFFSFCVVAMTVCVYYLFPETKGIDVERSDCIFRDHPFWKRFVVPYT